MTLELERKGTDLRPREALGGPPGALTQGRIERADSDACLAAWTRYGGAIRCPDASLADAIAAVVESTRGREPAEIYSELPKAARKPGRHRSCNLDVGFYTEAIPSGMPAAKRLSSVRACS